MFSSNKMFFMKVFFFFQLFFFTMIFTADGRVIGGDEIPLHRHDFYVKTVDCMMGPEICRMHCQNFVDCVNGMELKPDGFGCHNNGFCFCDMQQIE